jgi:branched-chain amino acid transport system permease protein
MGLPMWVWLPAPAIVPAAIGVIVGPTAVRVRGLYLAIVTLGLVFIGEYVWRNWVSSPAAPRRAGPSPPPGPAVEGGEPLFDFTIDSTVDVQRGPGIPAPAGLMLVVLIAVLAAKNIQRTRVGRAFQAIRDRDVAAEVMGVERVPLQADGVRHQLVLRRHRREPCWPASSAAPSPRPSTCCCRCSSSPSSSSAGPAPCPAR